MTAAKKPRDVQAQAATSDSLLELDDAIVACRACPRLVQWRETVASEKRKSYIDEEYWGKPVPGFGPDDAQIVVLGLAPGAHGANRTGRVFTGDRSGDWLYRAMFRAGLATQATSTSRDDGQALINTRLLAAVRCAPPDNKPSIAERDTCSPWLLRELQLLRPRVYVALGSFAWTALLTALHDLGSSIPTPRPKFGHGAEVTIDGVTVIGSYHPSQQNTFTGRLTEPMLDSIFQRAAVVAAQAPATSG